MTGRASVAARVAGVVVALGYLLGVVDGPVLGAVGGLALVTLGRGLTAPRAFFLLVVGGFAVLAGSSGVVALRWATLDLADLRGLHGVLGPSLVVGPPLLAGACAAGALGGLGAAAVWLSHSGPDDGGALLWGAEVVAAGLLLGTLALGPDIAGFGDLLWWSLPLVVTAAAALALRATRGLRTKVVLLGAASVLVVGGALVVGVVG